MSVIKNEGFWLAPELKFRKNTFCVPPCTPRKWDLLSSPLDLFLDEWRRVWWQAPFRQGGRRRMLQLPLCSPGMQLGHSSKVQESSTEFFLCVSGSEHISLTRVPCLPCQEHFGGEEFWVSTAKITKMLISWCSHAEVTPCSLVPEMLT